MVNTNRLRIFNWKLGKLKDDILLLQQEIIEVQDDVDSSQKCIYIPQDGCPDL